MKLTLAMLCFAASAILATAQPSSAHSHTGYGIDSYSFGEANERERMQRQIDNDFRNQRHETDQELDRLRSEMRRQHR